MEAFHPTKETEPSQIYTCCIANSYGNEVILISLKLVWWCWVLYKGSNKLYEELGLHLTLFVEWIQ